MIRGVIRYCKVTAADMLKVSTYQLSMACTRLGIKWPRFPQEPTPEHHKALNRKKKKERIPKNAPPFFYGEREEDGVVRFLEVRVSSDGRVVYLRWGRPGLSNNYAWRANKKTRFATREEALQHCQSVKAQHRPQDGWVEKEAPILPNARPKSKRKAMQGVQIKRKQFREQDHKVKEMMTANMSSADTHSQEEMEAATRKLEAIRSKMHRAVRQAKGLVEATKAQRKKVTDMKAANAEKPGTHSEEQIKREMHTLRELMSKYTKRTLVPPKDSRRSEAAARTRPLVGDEDDLKRLRPDLGPPTWAPPPPWPVQFPAREPPQPPVHQPVPVPVHAPTHVWCSGECMRLRKPWCTCSAPAPLMSAHSGHPALATPLLLQSSQAAAAAWHHHHAQVMASQPRGPGPGGMYFAGWPYGPLRLRVLSADEALTWPQLCLPDGARIPPAALGVRADPAGGLPGVNTVSTPLYFARELFEAVADPEMEDSLKRKRWERLWKGSCGREGPLMEYALWIEGGTSACGLAGGTTRSDALVSFNGIVLIIDAVGNDAARQWVREGTFFDYLQSDASPIEHTDLGGHAASMTAAGAGSVSTALNPFAGANEGPVHQALKLLLAAADQTGASNLKLAVARHLEELQLPSRGHEVPADS